MKYIYTLLLIMSPVLLIAQKGSQTFLVSYGFGNGQIKPILAMAKMSGSYAEGSVKTYGINFNEGIGKHASLETGIIALKHNYTYKEFRFPPVSTVSDQTKTSLIIPLKIKINILKYLFISGGMLLDVNLNGKGSTIGFGIGAGAQYYYKNKYGIFIYPQANVHSIEIGLAESHIAVGLAYRIQKKLML